MNVLRQIEDLTATRYELRRNDKRIPTLRRLARHGPPTAPQSNDRIRRQSYL